ncbi:hypothetical protein QFC20_002187 [Naganishia adeliensis]|uniref:Uncharacterized protein n=1 Tax=Naganishia adeliensis TaxID=92952 RepID=A0ACC2WM41_9TREE|nr:hypothetical protein QFC20_002187 [Naganishia adeliensis]
MPSSVEIPTLVAEKPTLYKTTDPLLKRLRLEDPYGRPIDTIAKDFEGKEVIIFFVGSAHGDAALKPLHHDLIDIAHRHHKFVSVIYCSADLSPKQAEPIVHNKPYLRMTMLDKSDFAPLVPMGTDGDKEIARLEKEEGIGATMRDEDFVTGGECERGEWKLELGKEEDENTYERPISRAALTMLTQSLGTPSLAVYHIPSHRFLTTNARRSAFRSNIVDTNIEKWRKGISTGMTWTDIWITARLPIILAIMAIFYQLAVFILGQDFNVIPLLFAKIEEMRG